MIIIAGYTLTEARAWDRFRPAMRVVCCSSKTPDRVTTLRRPPEQSQRSEDYTRGVVRSDSGSKNVTGSALP